MRILILAVGSQGDVAPYTGLGLRLREAGHGVAIAAAERFAPQIRAAGLEFRALPGDPRDAAATERGRRWQGGAGGALSIGRYLSMLAEESRELNDGMLAAAEQGTDLMLLSGSALLGYQIAEGMGIPSMGVLLQSILPTGEIPPLAAAGRSLGRLGNRAVSELTSVAIGRLFDSTTTELRRKVGLPRKRPVELRREWTERKWPVLHGFSPSVVPRPSDWRAGMEVTGFWWPHVDPAWTPPQRLTDFLDAGPPPVYVGFGSRNPGDSARLNDVVRAALRMAGVRGVVQAGWADLSIEDDDVITIGEAPHEWLFPKMAAVVHHCGAGTTAAGLRAGVPTAGVPVITDQPFWAARIAQLGAGPEPVPYRKLSAERLASAIRLALASPTHRLRARELSGRITVEDGAGRALIEIDRLLTRT
ncbi:glycosyltransferase [Allokutzneria multivorans]|uniref:Glycosyltransferase n=1 Tax=Allokutzneria multivorans TaxID=1142134 RepID=A0ABP7QZN5_9PSEU